MSKALGSLGEAKLGPERLEQREGRKKLGSRFSGLGNSLTIPISQVQQLWLNDLVPYCVAHQLTGVMYLQLPHDVGAVRFDGFNADTQQGS
jgi:hypothetical protein